MNKFRLPHLLSPLDLRGLALRNRVVMAPLTRARAGRERLPNDLMADYYAQRASAGLIVTEATVISEQGFGWVDSPGIYSDAQVAGWKKTTAALHAKGTPVFLQLWHCGRASHSSFHGGKPAVSASAIKLNGDHLHTPIGKQPYETPRALETAEVAAVVQDYRRAAERAKAAGFDGVEIHAANGYLIDQFLQSRTNHRTDRYGGSLENRFRFLKEIVEAIMTVLPANRVGVRLSPNGNFNDMGSPDYRETFTHAAIQLSAYGLAYLHVVDGLAFGFHELGQPMTLSEFRAVFNGPLMGCCGYTQETAEAAIASGQADLIAFGRPYLSNPDLVERFANGWELNPPADMKAWSAPTAAGYTDFPFHPPFQIDGNFGATAGYCEMLVQSHPGYIHPLPALPKAWPTGKVTGLCARSGFVVDMSWEGGRLTQAVIHSKSGLPCKVVCGDQSWEFNTKAGKSYPLKFKQSVGPRSVR